MTSQLPSLATSASAGNAAVLHADPAGRDGFMQQPFVQDILPFLTSLSFHAGIVILGLLAFAAVKSVRQPDPEEPAPVAATSMMQNSRPLALPGIKADQAAKLFSQDNVPSENGLNSFSGAKVEFSPAGGGAEGNAKLIAPGLLKGFGERGSLGTKGGPHTGSGDDGPAGLWGTPSQGLGAGTPMFAPAPAHKIAYVCDASGSMINKMASLKAELLKAVQGLRASQSFSIIFFQDNRSPIVLDSALTMATPQTKRKASKFLDDVMAVGTTDPIPGIEAAFRQQPELIYLLTDGDFPDNAAVLAKVRELNKGKRVKVNTIAFVGAGDSDTAFIDLLKQIATENGGTYRHVTEDELQ